MDKSVAIIANGDIIGEIAVDPCKLEKLR